MDKFARRVDLTLMFTTGDVPAVYIVFQPQLDASVTGLCIYDPDSISVLVYCDSEADQDTVRRTIAHEMRHCVDCIRAWIGENNTTSEPLVYLETYLVSCAQDLWTSRRDELSSDQWTYVAKLLARQGYASEIGEKKAKLVSHKPKHSIFIAPSCAGKTTLAASLIRAGYSVLDFDALVWHLWDVRNGVKNQICADKLRLDPVVRVACQRYAYYLLPFVRRYFDVVLTNVVPENSLDAIVFLLDPGKAFSRYEERCRIQSKPLTWTQKDAELWNQRAAKYANRHKIPVVQLDDYLLDYWNSSTGMQLQPELDSEIVYKHFDNVLAKSGLFSINLAPERLRTTRTAQAFAAHTAVDVRCTVVPVIGLTGLGAETLCQAMRPVDWIRGDNFGSRTSPWWEYEWDYDPYYVWRKALQYSEDGKVHLMSVTGGPKVAEMLLLPYPKAVILRGSAQLRLTRAEEWRKNHNIGPLPKHQVEKMSEDEREWNKRLLDLARFRNLSNYLIVDANESVSSLKLMVQKYLAEPHPKMTEVINNTSNEEDL